jgi:hypothetical protein
MARDPIENRPPISQRLIRAREAAGFTNAKAFLAAVKASQGKAPSYSSYAQWESGEVTPRTISLKPVWAFHETREAAEKPAVAPEPTPDPIVVALTAQTKALEAQTKIIEALVGELQNWRTSDRERIAALEQTPSPEAMAAQVLRALEVAGVILAKEPSETETPTDLPASIHRGQVQPSPSHVAQPPRRQS